MSLNYMKTKRRLNTRTGDEVVPERIVFFDDADVDQRREAWNEIMRDCSDPTKVSIFRGSDYAGIDDYRKPVVNARLWPISEFVKVIGT